MTQLWYEIKKLGSMQISKCSLCQGTLRQLKQRPMGKNDVIVIMADVNCFGNLISYHIGRTTRDKVKGTALAQDLEEKA